MKKVLKIVVVGLFVGLIAIQFVRPAQTNPPIVVEQTLEATTQVPEEVQKIFARSCNDCHTNNTVYPWYAKIQPSGWFLANHIEDGRRHLNFSEWTTYETRRKHKKLDEICEQVQAGEMPLPSYLWIHGSAKLTEAEIKTVCDWTDAERARMENSEVK